MKKHNKPKFVSLMMLSLALLSFGVMKTVNPRAYAEDKKYNGQPYDIVIQYERFLERFLKEWMRIKVEDPIAGNHVYYTDEELKEQNQEVATRYNLLDEKLAGTGNPQTDLLLVEQHLEKKIEEVRAVGCEDSNKGCIDFDKYEKPLVLDKNRLPNECDPAQVYTIEYFTFETIVPTAI